MEYIAHKDGERIQTVKEHLYGTAELAGFFAEKFGKKEWGYCCGMLHDLGKYSKEFQRKIQNDTGERVDHSTAGAKVCNEKGGYYSILSYCIAGHHAGLPETLQSATVYVEDAKKGSVISKIIKMKYKFQCFIQIRLCLIQLKI